MTRFLCEPIGHRRAGKVLGRQSALAVRRIDERDPLEVDRDVWMMIGRLSPRNQSVDEGNGLRKPRERVLLPNGLPVKDPPLQILHLFIDLRPRQFGHWFAPHRSPKRCGLMAARAGSILPPSIASA